jgi:glycolate oxidase
MKIDETFDFPTIDRESLLSDLRKLVAGSAVLSEPEELKPYECDALSAYREVPMAVVLPDTIEQVRAIMRLCHRLQVPVVARGAGTGLSGGSLPFSKGILLSLARFNRILEIDVKNRSARVQPGVRNLAISEAVAEHNLFYAPDPSSQIACSIGGNVAENSGGVHCLKYGLTVHNLLDVTIVTADGELLQLGGPALDSSGYDLLAAITGSEGLLGIVVEVQVKLTPKPECARLVMAAFGTVLEAGEMVSEVIGAGIIPAGMEMMDRLSIHATEDFVHAGYPLDAAAIILCELDGSVAEVEQQIELVQGIAENCNAREVRLAVDETERDLFWAGRKAAFPAIGRLSPDYYCMDGTIPRSRLPEVLNKMTELSEQFGLRVANVFHAGDGNLHPLILYDASVAGELEKTETLGGKILELCIEVGGTITGEHGVGIEKINQMCVQFNDAEREQFHALKFAFDPLGILNPGKAVPTLHRCAEFGAMHVHANRLPHPDLPRF